MLQILWNKENKRGCTNEYQINNFHILVICGLGPSVAHRPPVGYAGRDIMVMRVYLCVCPNIFRSSGRLLINLRANVLTLEAIHLLHGLVYCRQ